MWYFLITKICTKEVDKVLFSCGVPMLYQKILRWKMRICGFLNCVWEEMDLQDNFASMLIAIKEHLGHPILCVRVWQSSWCPSSSQTTIILTRIRALIAPFIGKVLKPLLQWFPQPGSQGCCGWLSSTVLTAPHTAAPKATAELSAPSTVGRKKAQEQEC